MAKISLNQVVNNINTNYELMKGKTREDLVSSIDKTKIFTEQKLEFSNLEKQKIAFQRQKQKLDLIETSTEREVQHWITSRSSSPSSSIEVREVINEERERIVKKAKWVKCAQKVVLAFAATLAILSLLGWGALFAIADGSRALVSLATFTKVELIAGGATFFALISGLSSFILNQVKVVRQKRALSSANFNYFVDVYLKAKGFDLHHRELVDWRLHQIYREWKSQISALSQ